MLSGGLATNDNFRSGAFSEQCRKDQLNGIENAPNEKTHPSASSKQESQHSPIKAIDLAFRIVRIFHNHKHRDNGAHIETQPRNSAITSSSAGENHMFSSLTGSWNEQV